MKKYVVLSIMALLALTACDAINTPTAIVETATKFIYKNDLKAFVSILTKSAADAYGTPQAFQSLRDDLSQYKDLSTGTEQFVSYQKFSNGDSLFEHNVPVLSGPSQVYTVTTKCLDHYVYVGGGLPTYPPGYPPTPPIGPPENQGHWEQTMTCLISNIQKM